MTDEEIRSVASSHKKIFLPHGEVSRFANAIGMSFRWTRFLLKGNYQDTNEKAPLIREKALREYGMRAYVCD